MFFTALTLGLLLSMQYLPAALFTVAVIVTLLAVFFLRGALPRYRIDSVFRLVWHVALFILLSWITGTLAFGIIT